MNKDRINYAIEIMKQAQNLNMTLFQAEMPDHIGLRHGTTETTTATTIENLHTCGNTACFAGYIALSPLFKELGGVVDYHGAPKLYGGRGTEALLGFFEIDTEGESPDLLGIAFIHGLVYGPEEELDWDNYLETENLSKETLDKIYPDEDGDVFLNCEWMDLETLVGDCEWADWEPEHVILLLKKWRDGKLEMVEF